VVQRSAFAEFTRQKVNVVGLFALRTAMNIAVHQLQKKNRVGFFQPARLEQPRGAKQFEKD